MARPATRSCGELKLKLREIGSHLLAVGIPMVEMRVPAALCERAKAAWEREDEQDDSVERETREQSAVRHRAAILALIGLALHENGRRDGDEFVVVVSADLVGEAVSAVEEES